MNAQTYRLAEGGGIDRSAPLTFRFDGRPYAGYRGDTLASALLANGVRTVARSFKYHRPRGVLSAGSEEPTALVQVGSDPATTVPNVRATELELYDGLEAFPQNCWPSLRRDVGAVNDAFARFLPAGFYYKTFMGPPLSWMRFEGPIRAAAGMGKSPSERDPDRYEHVNRHCEVLVVGGGAAGLVAARAAARAGARVILAEETAELGGGLLASGADAVTIDGRPARTWLAEVAAELRAMPEVTVLTRTTGTGWYDRNWVTLAETLQDHLPPAARDPRLPRQRLWRVRATSVVLATGAIERPLLFHANDRPGVMLAGAVRAYLHRWGVAPGRRAVVATNNNDAWRTAFDLAAAGVEIAAVVDSRERPDERLVARAKALGLPVRMGAAVLGARGRREVRGATIARSDGGGREEVRCDLLAVSGGWAPNLALYAQSKGAIAWNDDLQAFRPKPNGAAAWFAGGAAGTFDLTRSLRDAALAGAVAAGAEAGDAPEGRDDAVAYALAPAPKPSGGRVFVDLQNDVTTKDLQLAVREGYASAEHAKRYTTLGMGTDQGKTSGLNGVATLAETLGKTIPEVGVTTFRPPYKPVSFGAVAGQHVGELFHPRRTTAMHEAHVEAGAVFELVGDWLRPRVYPRGGESFDDALMRECKAARTACAVLDASTLGKIDVRGPDAREFLNRVYTNAWLKLAPGRCRYGLMCNEDGMVFDDGVTACLADDHFHMTTTTGGAAGVLAWLEEYLQTEWPELKVYLTSVTEQWAVASLCGPASPKLAAELFDDIDADPEIFPFMSHTTGHIEGVPVRVFRISFTGEVTYEINVPARYGLWLWRLILERGAKYGITPYGTEGMHLLRAEKGFIIAGQDTDGTVTPLDLGMRWAVKNSADFIGRRSLFRSDTARPDRRQLVGLLTVDPAVVLAEGAQVIAEAAEQRPRTRMIGHVTSSYFSPNLERSIALALIEGGQSREGETVHVARRGAAPIAARLADTDFLSNTGEGS
jgi:sarcosine oxidase subunit alpha